MATKLKINIGLEVAKYIYRQTTDPRVKGIYCGGYIMKFLKGFEIFQDLDPTVTGIPSPQSLMGHSALGI